MGYDEEKSSKLVLPGFLLSISAYYPAALADLSNRQSTVSTSRRPIDRLYDGKGIVVHV